MEKTEIVQEIKETIREADMVLVGLGEEFDDTRIFREDEGYQAGKQQLADSEMSWLVPAWQELFRMQEKNSEAESRLVRALENLRAVLEGKNYFVVSVSTNDRIRRIDWREGRLVAPCGGILYKQCGEGCPNNMTLVSEQERSVLFARLQEWRQTLYNAGQTDLPQIPAPCPNCGKVPSLNNIYHPQYNEEGYLSDWNNYTKWLQGTLNRRLIILELGVGMQYPSVVRWPFEKIAFFNQKAYFYRINKNLYQLTEELSKKGASIEENAIDWLQNLC